MHLPIKPPPNYIIFRKVRSKIICFLLHYILYFLTTIPTNDIIDIAKAGTPKYLIYSLTIPDGVKIPMHSFNSKILGTDKAVAFRTPRIL